MPVLHHPPNLKILLAIRIKIYPLPDLLLDLLLCLPFLSLGPDLAVAAADNLLFVVEWHVHHPDPAQVVGGVFLETTRYKASCSVATREEAVAPARAISMATGGDIKYYAING